MIMIAPLGGPVYIGWMGIQHKWRSKFFKTNTSQVCLSNTLEVIVSTVMKKWKWLFMNGCKCKGPISTVMERLKLCRTGASASLFLGTVLRNNYIYLE
jgi:hypothetical protein